MVSVEAFFLYFDQPHFFCFSVILALVADCSCNQTNLLWTSFFKQERWGEKNKRIICYKFRSMVKESKDIDINGKYRQARKNDPRVTKFGRFLRRTNLDETPQFMNVLKGEMSIVGPLPHPTPLNLEAQDNVRQYRLCHFIKPGITGWAQVNGFRGETNDPFLMQKRINHDLWYIENWTFWLDVQIILR